MREECSMKEKSDRRARRSFSAAFKADAVKLVKAGASPGQVSKQLDLTETALREWVRRADADAGVGNPDVLTTEERHELSRLRRENKTLRMEREILKAAATFFAKENA
jgi:transposase